MQYETMTGPEFLDAVAQQSTAQGLDINAAAYRERAAQWQRDQQERDQQRARADDLEARLAHIADHAANASKCGALTPTDRR